MFEHEHPGVQPGPGVVTYITASSYLDGDAFLGMREHMRRLCDEIWIVDLGGEGRGTRQEENVFNIQTPVAIAIAVRYGAPNSDTPAQVHYCRLEGNRAAKLQKLELIEGFRDLRFELCPTDWHAPFRPQGKAAFFDWPQIIDLMPWQHSGVQGKRTWPIGQTSEVLSIRWKTLLTSTNRAKLFKKSTDRLIGEGYKALWSDLEMSKPIANLPPDAPCPRTMPYGYRSFDRQYIFADTRLISRPREALWQSQSRSQIFFASLLSSLLGDGPALTVSADVPDLHFFRGSFGAKEILPLFRDAQARHPNLHPELAALLESRLGQAVAAEEIAAYFYAVLAHPGYTAHFREELENREVRVPIALDPKLFEEAVHIGKRLIYLHTYGERLASGQTWPHGLARCTKAVATGSLPEKCRYDEASQTLIVGNGEFRPVALAVWEFEVSGLKVLQSWLGYRMKKRKGRRSSPLDDITPDSWSPEFTSELLRLLHLLEETLEIYPRQADLLKRITQGPLLNAADLGPPPNEYRRSPASHTAQEAFEM